MKKLGFVTAVMLLSMAMAGMSACDDDNTTPEQTTEITQPDPGPEYPVITELSEREFSGTVGYVPNPPTTDPALPGVVAGLLVGSEEYVLIVDGHMVWELPMVYGDITLNASDKVKIIGNACSVKLTAEHRGYSQIEVEDIELIEKGDGKEPV